jgi:hypothetical protein
LIVFIGILALVLSVVVGVSACKYGRGNAINFIMYDKKNIVILGSLVEFEIFRGLNYEMMFCQFKDGLHFQILTVERDTNADELFKEHTVWVDSVYIRNMVKLLRREMSEVDFIIHNHPVNPEFSDADKQCADELRSHGFVGKFLLWHKGEVKEY